MKAGKKVLITGGSGFIGSRLIRYLLSYGCVVASVARSMPANKAVSWIRLDDSLQQSIERFMPDCTIHLAAEFNNRDVKAIVDCNLMLPLQILEVLIKLPVKNRNYIAAGSYWQNGDYRLPRVPIDQYSASKKAINSFVDYYSGYCELNSIELILHGSYGDTDRRKKLLDLLISHAGVADELALSLGEQELNMVHVDDICAAFWVAMENMQKDFYLNDSYSIVSANTYTVTQLVSIVERVSGKKINANFGGRPYRDVEVFKAVHLEPVLPNWRESITLERYLKDKLRN